MTNETRGRGVWRAIERVLPGVRVLRTYRREWLAADVFAGAAVCLLSIPMALACAGLVGLDVRHGLFTALAGLVVFALFTSSRIVVVGPDTAVAILVAGAVAPLAGGDPQKAAALAALLGVLTGFVMLGMAAARIGAVADFLSRPVLVGFMNGAALIVITAQAGKLLGLRIGARDPAGVVRELWARAGEVDGSSAALGLGALGAMFLIGWLLPKGPGALLVVVAATVAAFAFGLEGRGVAVVGPVPAGLPAPALPEGGLDEIFALLPAAAGIAFLTFPEAILLARAFDGRRSGELDPNRELVALGAADVFSGAFQGFPLAASSTRTPLSAAAGGRTQVASLVAAGLLVVFLLFLTPLVAKVPGVVLAALLVHAGLRLVDLETMASIWRLSWKSGVIGMLTTVVVLFVGVIPGILVGVLLSLLVVIRQVSRPPDAVLRRVLGRKGMHDVQESDGGTLVPGLVAYRFYAPLIFSNASWFVDRLRTLVARAEPRPKCVLLDAQAVSDLDITAADEIHGFVEELRGQGIAFSVANVNRPLRRELDRYRLTEVIGEENLHKSVNNALKAFLSGSVVPSEEEHE